MNDRQQKREIEARFSQVHAQLSLCSHVGSALKTASGDPDDSESAIGGKGIEPAQVRSSDGEVGGNRPPGGVDHRDDRVKIDAETGEPAILVLRSADCFRRRFNGAHSIDTLAAILEEAEQCLNHWRKAPEPTEPPKNHPRWKQWVRETDLPVKDLAKKYGCKSSYISKVRREDLSSPEKISTNSAKTLDKILVSC